MVGRDNWSCVVARDELRYYKFRIRGSFCDRHNQGSGSRYRLCCSWEVVIVISFELWMMMMSRLRSRKVSQHVATQVADCGPWVAVESSKVAGSRIKKVGT